MSHAGVTVGGVTAVAAPAPAGTKLAPLDHVASTLAAILLGQGTDVVDPDGTELDFEPLIEPRPLPDAPTASEVWAVDGGQALVADARCLRVFVTRASLVCFRDGACVVEEEGALRADLLSGTRVVGADGPLGVAADAPVDVNVLRDRAEWDAVSVALDRAAPGALVLLDGDLVPDWRLPGGLVEGLIARATERRITLAAVTKHSSLSRGGAPLVGQLEVQAASALGPRARWWAPVGRTRPGASWPPVQVVVARLDPDARYAFRIDLPRDADAEPILGALADVSNDAAFPGYPYPLSVADRLAACPGWLRADAWLALDEGLERAGVSAETRERAFDDRHRLMERA